MIAWSVTGDPSDYLQEVLPSTCLHWGHPSQHPSQIAGPLSTVSITYFFKIKFELNLIGIKVYGHNSKRLLDLGLYYKGPIIRLVIVSLSNSFIN